MLHLEVIESSSTGETPPKLLKKATGRYYTGEMAGNNLARQMAAFSSRLSSYNRPISVIDPFGGDGRLVAWLLQACVQMGCRASWHIFLWDIDGIGFDVARSRFEELKREAGLHIEIDCCVVDTFEAALSKKGQFDIVITNPPWELLKPDRRDLESLPLGHRASYVERMREYDAWISHHYPLSQPKRKFAGWGTNLSRVGLEASLSLVHKDGLVGAILPASMLADDQTVNLRKYLLTKHRLLSVDYYPAEAKLYEGADIASIGLVVDVEAPPNDSICVTSYSADGGVVNNSLIAFDKHGLEKTEYVMPVSFGARLMALRNRLAQRYPAWSDLEANSTLWAGRELDETRIDEYLTSDSCDRPLFLKGRMIGRFQVLENPSLAVRKENWAAPPSVAEHRIVWRDVSRPNQKRRMIATMAQPGWIAGNSLGVAYFKAGDTGPLFALLGVMSSLTFEFQLRAHLATGHISLSSVRKVAVPDWEELRTNEMLVQLVQKAIDERDEIGADVDAYVAKFMYELTEDEYCEVLDLFPKFSFEERELYLSSFRAL